MLRRNIDYTNYTITVHSEDSHKVVSILEEFNLRGSSIFFTKEAYNKKWKEFDLIPPEIIEKVIKTNDILPNSYYEEENNKPIPEFDYSEFLKVALESGLITENIRYVKVTSYEAVKHLALPDYTGGSNNDE